MKLVIEFLNKYKLGEIVIILTLLRLIETVVGYNRDFVLNLLLVMLIISVLSNYILLICEMTQRVSDRKMLHPLDHKLNTELTPEFKMSLVNEGSHFFEVLDFLETNLRDTESFKWYKSKVSFRELGAWFELFSKNLNQESPKDSDFKKMEMECRTLFPKVTNFITEAALESNKSIFSPEIYDF